MKKRMPEQRVLDNIAQQPRLLADLLDSSPAVRRAMFRFNLALERQKDAARKSAKRGPR